MSNTPSRSGGIFLPIGMFAGLAIGIFAGEPMIGVLGGTAAGAAAAIALWLKDRSHPPIR